MDIQELLKDHRSLMTQFQHDHFVTGKAGTPYAQYKQAVRELAARIEVLREEYASLEHLYVSIDEKAHIKENDESEFERRRAAIDHKCLHRQIPTKENRIKEQEDETLSFYRQSVQLKKVVGELTPEKEAQYTEEMWEYKIKKMAALDIMSSGRLSAGTLDTAISLRGDMRTRVMKALNDPNSLVQQVEEQSEEFTQVIDETPSIERLDFKSLLLTEK